MANALGYVKPKYEGDKSTRTIGAAQVVEIDNKVKIIYLEQDDWKKKDGSKIKITHPDGNVVKVIEMSQSPIHLEEGFNEILVVTSDEEKGITQFAPYEGQFRCQFVEFGHPNGEGTPAIWKESEPKTWSDKNGTKTYTTLDFRAYYKVSTNPFFKGVALIHFLRYMFADKGGFAGYTFKLLTPSRAEKSTQGQKLLDCLISGSAVDEPIVWPEDGNILPELERRLQSKNKFVTITVKEGWITDISPVSKLSDDAEPATKKEEVVPKQTEITPALDEM
jgi:hypothetical protein